MNRAAHRLVLLAVFVLVVGAPMAMAQSTGMVKGKVVDGEGKPVEDAKVTITFEDGANRSFETKSNKKGEYIQIGLQSGSYTPTAAKDKVGTQSFNKVRVRAGAPVDVNFVLSAAAAAASGNAAAAVALKKAFDDGVAASKAGNHDEAIAKFQEAAGMIPNCSDCYYNIGFAYSQKKDYDKAVEAFNKAIELKPDFGNAYTGLATVYNSQKKFDEAAKASAKASELSGAAGGGGGAEALYNQGVILWNGGKIPEAKKMFEDAIKADPNHADAHYQLGMALLNEGKLSDATGEFETYLKLAPTGQYAAQAKSMIATLKK